VTLKSWLSHLYYGSANAETLRHIARTQAPLLIVSGTADYGGDVAEAVYEAAATSDKQLEYVQGATHWFESHPDHLNQAMTIISDWLSARGF
jgi:alpha-beta hydrolase superfamily lysophospholipase